MSEPVLKATARAYFEVYYRDLNDFISETFGISYNCVAMQEWCNDSKYTIHVDGKLDSIDAADYRELKDSRLAKSWRLRTYLNGMCSDGLIPSGVYLINVSW